MSEVPSDDPHDPRAPESGARPASSSPAQNISPAWESAGPSLHTGDSAAQQKAAASNATGFTLEHGNRSSMTGTAERIGGAVGSAQRQLRRGLELVRKPAAQPGFSSSSEAEQDEAGRVYHAVREGVERASVMAETIVEKAGDARQRAAQQLDEWSEEAGERFQLFRSEISSALSRSRERAKRLVGVYPLQTIAAMAGICFAAGVALRLSRRSHRG